jgi:D-alanyl-D-alanine dipeptidase
MALLRVPLERMGALPALNPKGSVCVDELGSASYNRMLDSEHSTGATGRALDRIDARYDVAVVVDHNGFGSLDVTPRKGRGSCTFLHVWRRKGAPTDGGTAMAREDLEELVRWLDPARRPVLVQLPKDQLLHKRGLWGIP